MTSSTEGVVEGTGPPPAPPASGRGEDGATLGRVRGEDVAERLHPIALLSGLGKSLRNMVGGLFAGGFVAFQGKPMLGLFILAGIVLSTTIGLALHWWRFSFRVGGDALRIDSGIIGRNHRTIPFDRVQDVSIVQGPLQRLVGVARVTLETGGSSAGQEEGVLDGIGLARAEALRDLVRARRGLSAAPTVAGTTIAGTAIAGTAEDSAAPLPMFTMDRKRLVTLGLFNFSLALLAGLFGVSQTIGNVAGFDPFERGFWQPILTTSGWGAWILGHQLILGVAGAVVLMITGLVTGIVRTVMREWGFRLDRLPGGLRRRRGLLTRTDVSLPLRRIQAGVIATGPIRQRLGWSALSVQSLASDQTAGAGGGDHVLAPLARLEELDRVTAELGWRLPDGDTQWRMVSFAHVTSFCVALLPLFPLLLVLGPLRWLEWKRTAFVLEEQRLLVRTGWWQRRMLILPLAKVHSVDLIETSLSRRFGVASLAIGTAGGRMLGHRIPALPRDDARVLRRALLSRLP